MSLLDFNLPSIDTPQGQGLLSAAFSLMRAQKNPGQRGALGNALGEAGQTYLQTTDSARDAALRRQYIDMQMQETQSQIEKRRADAAKQARLMEFINGKFGQPNPPAQSSGSVESGTNQTAQPTTDHGGLGMSARELAYLKLNGLDLTDVAKLGIPSRLGNGWVQGVDGNREYLGDPAKGFASDGKSVSLMPGFLAANNAIEGGKAQATESAKAGLDLVDVPISDGSKRMMPRLDAVRLLGGQAQQQPAQPMQNIGTAKIGADIRSLIAKDAAANGIANPVINIDSPQPGQTMTLASSQPRVMLGQSQTPAQIGQQKTITDAAGKINDTWLKSSYEPTVMAGQAAQSVIDSTNIARRAMRSMGGTGWGSEVKAGALNVLTSLGVAPKSAEMYASNAQIFQRSAMDRLWTTLNTAKGIQTEGDADRAAKTYGRLANTTQANEFIFDLAQATAERDKMKAAFFSNALPIAQQSGDLSEVQREWDKRMPSIFAMPTMRSWGEK